MERNILTDINRDECLTEVCYTMSNKINILYTFLFYTRVSVWLSYYIWKSYPVTSTYVASKVKVDSVHLQRENRFVMANITYTSSCNNRTAFVRSLLWQRLIAFVGFNYKYIFYSDIIRLINLYYINGFYLYITDYTIPFNEWRKVRLQQQVSDQPLRINVYVQIMECI